MKTQKQAMIRFLSLGSGSSGNGYYLEADGYAIMIDFGLGRRYVKKALHDFGLTLASIHAIVVTHDHTDHVKSVGAFATEFHLPVYASSMVHMGISRNRFMSKKVPPEQVRLLEAGETIQLGPFSITSFHVPHDSAGNNGYFIAQEGGPTFLLMTDVGHFTDEMLAFVPQADYMVVEANYDPAMLQNGPYPEYLKQRITSGRGHLSNRQTAEVLATHLTERTRRVWLCHLSEENNHPELARITVENTIRQQTQLFEKGLQLEVLRRKVPTGIYELK